jgi:lactate permease
VLGLVTGFFPIGWIVLNVIFLYRLTVEKARSSVCSARSAASRRPAPAAAADRLLVRRLLRGRLGLRHAGRRDRRDADRPRLLAARGLRPSLIANTAPVAYGALGTPIQGSPRSPARSLSLGAMVGRQLPFFSLIVPFWLIWAFAGWKGMKEIWPAILVTGVSFADPAVPDLELHQSVDRRHRRLADLDGLPDRLPEDLAAQGAVAVAGAAQRDDSAARCRRQAPQAPEPTRGGVARLMPWIIVCVVLLVWGTGWFKAAVNPYATWSYPVPELHNLIQKVPPVAAKPTPEPAVFAFTWLTYTGSGMLIAAIISGLLMGFGPIRLVSAYARTIRVTLASLITISAMLAIGTLTRFSGLDATLGLAFAGTGVLYPFFGTLLGWLGVALTGSDTASNVLFGNLQRITSEQLGLSPVLMSAANSSGGVMGKMIDAQSIVVASTATNWFGHEGSILRFVFWHSIALACLVGVLVMLQAYVFTGMIVHP